MGTFQHDVVIVEGYEELKNTERLKNWIRQLSEEDQKYFSWSEPLVNNYVFVLMWPDGSKEGWEESSRGDDLRREFIKKVRELGLYVVHFSWGDYGYIFHKERTSGE